jgi:sugar lactone lactonase YvrE
MSTKTTLIALSLLFTGTLSMPAAAGDGGAFPEDASFATLITTPLVVEGLAGDDRGNLYTPGRQAGNGVNCPVWRIDIENPSLVPVGFIPAPDAMTQCSPSGLAFDQLGMLYVAEADKIYRFFPNADTPPLASEFASGLPGTNGVAFDGDGNLWTGDGTTGQGRVWKVAPTGVVTEEFRIQPMANEVNLNAGVGGVGRDARTLPPGTITVTPTSRSAANTAGSQPLVANGVAFDKHGDLFVADTARGAIWKVKLDRHGNVRSRTNCDTTFPGNTLCLENIFVAHPLLEGADGIALDRDGNIWVSVNERNAIVVVTDKGKVIEVFRNAPDPATQLRNAGQNGGQGLLEFPTSPFLSGRTLCTANSDGNRRDNSPSTAGEIGGQDQGRGKISCMEQGLPIPGLPLPVR